MSKRLYLLSFLSIISISVFGQGFNPGFEERHPYPVRAFLNKFSVNLSSGYGRTFYRHDFSNYAYIRNERGSFLISAADANEGNTVNGLENWFTDVTPAADIALRDDFAMVTFDSIDGPLKASGYHIPVNLAIYYNLQRLRIGGGANVEFHQATFPEPDNFLSAYPSPEAFSTTMSRWFFLLGYSVYEYYDYAFGVDLRAGQYRLGSGFNEEITQTTPFINLGVSIEKVFSEYFRVYLRPSYEFKSYSITLPENALQVNNHAVNLTLGVSINYPDLPRSPIPNDEIQMKHYVSDSQGNRMLVRGQPFWKKQDPKIGELYPELIKSKRKRRTQLQFFKKKNKK